MEKTGKFKKGDKVEYIDLKDRKVQAVIIAYEEIKIIICEKEIINVCAKLSNGEYVNDRHLNKVTCN